MTNRLSKLIQSITDINNKYRDPNSSTKQKIIALWEMGNCLQSLGVKKPHSVGWSIQEETKGVIKRPTIFRSYKIKQIWPDKDKLLNDIGNLKQMSFLIEMLPLVDPAQGVRKKMSVNELQSIHSLACSNDATAFKSYLAKLKKKYSHGRLGKPLDKEKHLEGLDAISNGFRKLQATLSKLFAETEKNEREIFKGKIPSDEFVVFSNMCLSLTTKDNFRLYKGRGPEVSNAKDESFKFLYDSFRDILSKSIDTERARLRRLISAEAFAQLSDMISSIRSEDSVKDYRARQRLSIGL